ncbi:MAG: hypothetical protein WA705_30685 [Candidatus Ozemobacteraceae bacterium]
MVDSINSGGKILIVTKPKPKTTTEKTKEAGFDKVLNERSEVETPRGAPLRSAELKPAMVDRQGMARMQRLEVIARQIREGSYQLVDPDILADRLLKAAFDPKTRAKFLKKAIADEMDQAKAKNRPLSDLDLKKLLMIIKGGPDENFDDPELDELLKELT